MAVQLLTKSAYARHRGCDEKAVRKAIQDGRISTIDGKIDPEVADIQWAKNTRARADSKRTAPQEPLAGMDAATAPAGPASGPAGSPDYSDNRARREKAEADMAERANLREAGQVLDRQQVERAVFDIVHSLRDAVMAVGQRAAAKCIGLADARDIERAITEECRQALAAFEQRALALMPSEEVVAP